MHASIRLVLVTFVLASSASAQFSAPVALPGDLAVGPAAGDQRNVAVARGVDQSLMVWEDFRASLGGTVGYSSTGNGILCAARLDAAGAVIDTTPIVVRGGQRSPIEPKVAWNGAQYLVVWAEYVPHAFETDRGVFAARVDPAGHVLDDPPLLLEDTSYVQEFAPVVASDGSNWAVAWGGLAGGLDAIEGCLVDANGVPGPLRTMMTTTSGFYYPVNFEMAWANGRYLFVSEHFPVGASSQYAMGQLFDPALNRIGTEFTLGAGTGFGTNPCVAGNDAEFCVVWNSAAGMRATPVGANGVVLVPGGVDVSGALYVGYQLPSVAWDGRQWVLAFGSSSGTGGAMHAVRMSPGGVVLGGSPVTIDQGNWTMARPACARTQTGSQIVWADARNSASIFAPDQLDLFSATLSSGGIPGASSDLSVSPPAQTNADLAGDAAHGYLVVFLSQTQTTATIAAQRVDSSGAAVDAQPIALSVGPRTKRSPAVAWNGANWLVVWEEVATGGSTTMGARVSPGGAMLDAAPFAVMAGGGPDVAAAGGDYLVVSSHEPMNHFRYVYSRRVRGSDGALLDPAPIQLTGSYDTQPAVAGFDDRWIVAWAHTVTHDAPFATIRYLIVDASGALTPAAVGGSGTSTNNEPSLAVDGAQALLVWTSGGDVLARRILRDGAKLDTDAGIPVSTANNAQFAPAVGWDGAEFTVAFADYRAHVNPLETGVGDVYAARVSAAGAVLDPNGLAVSAVLSAPEGQPAVANAAGPCVVSFSALRTEAPFANWRIALTTRGDTTGTAFCFGDGSGSACPCGNSGSAAHGCDNSASTGGARLTAAGTTHPDTVVLTANGELPSTLSIVLQGDAELGSGVAFGDGIRCVAGSMKRLYVKNANGGALHAPGAGDASITARSASLGDPILPGTSRSYQVYYRDPSPAFCPAPAGNSWNVSNGIRIAW